MIIKIGKVLKIRLWVLIVLITYLIIVLFAWFLKNDVLLLFVTISAMLGTIAGLIWWAVIYKATPIEKLNLYPGRLQLFFAQ